MRNWKQGIWGGLIVMLAALAMSLPQLARAEFGANWTAQYYNNTTLSGEPVDVRTGLAGVNFNYGTGAPGGSVNPDNFSIRFSSTQTFAGASYEFVASSDDGIRVFIDGELLLDRYVTRPLTTDRFTRTMTAGTHSLVVEYFDSVENASVQFQWFQVGAGTVVQPVVTNPVVQPVVVGYTPIANIGGTPGVFATTIPTPTGPTVSITFVRGLALRTGPYLGATMVTVLTREPLNVFSVSGRNQQEGIYPWFYVTSSDGRQGWASGRYLILNNVELAALPEMGSVFDGIDGAGDVGADGIARARLSLRVRPSERTARIDIIPYGEQFALIGRTVQASTNRWFQVRRANGQVGWVTADFVEESGPMGSVPIR